MDLKIAIADDHVIIREGFKAILKLLDNVSEVFETSNGAELIEIVKTKKPDLVFTDINMPMVDGFEATREIINVDSKVKVIALTSYDNIEYINKMLELGVAGYMLKDAEYNEVREAIEIVMNDKPYFSNKILVILTNNTVSRQNQKKIAEFTKRETDVLHLLCNGSSKKQIAEKLFISERTVEKYKEKMMDKTYTKSTVNLVIYAIKNNIISFD